ncbi:MULTISPECIES: hypothetical protein [Marinobacter]|uniref:Uncharacterized protein n=1 Tax=Marinobacter nauticus (strain ATCC 700491 / DSM 11845 / VT8) TaxID=351348 RepID=A1U804_MARN8|nr:MULTISPECIES: hypothetical protein [Marinobacter]ABM21123.1 hypothetical protein Maqu_4272 [Marinobacter nauticus VT8]
MGDTSFSARRSVLSAMVAAGLALGSQQAAACSCIVTATTGAVQISGTVATGSAAIVAALQLGFDKTAVQVNASSADSADRIVSALEGMTNALREDIIAQPAIEAAVKADLEEKSPAYHATNECEYINRTNDSKAADVILGAQQEALANSVVAYNEITSQYEETVNPEVAFKAQTNQLLTAYPGVKTAPINIIDGPNRVGAMTSDEFRDASRALNLTLNPMPAPKIAAPSTPAEINMNVDADLFNMRMQLPQGVSQTILSYEAPLLDLPEDSWFSSILKRMSPAEYEAFTEDGRSVSYSDLLKHMATHRMKDPVSVANAATKGEVGLKKDLALVKADHLVMDYELWLQDRYQSLLLSQLVSSQIRQERK